jgi:hypothetical protein
VTRRLFNDAFTFAEVLMQSTETDKSIAVLSNTLHEETATADYYNVVPHSIRLNIFGRIYIVQSSGVPRNFVRGGFNKFG